MSSGASRADWCCGLRAASGLAQKGVHVGPLGGRRARATVEASGGAACFGYEPLNGGCDGLGVGPSVLTEELGQVDVLKGPCGVEVGVASTSQRVELLARQLFPELAGRGSATLGLGLSDGLLGVAHGRLLGGLELGP